MLIFDVLTGCRDKHESRERGVLSEPRTVLHKSDSIPAESITDTRISLIFVFAEVRASP